MRTFCSIERPMTATLRPKLADASRTCWTRAMLLAKVATMMRPVEPLHDLAEGLADGPLGRRVAGVLGARRVRQQAQHALGAEAGQQGEVGQLAVDRRVVELEVAGVDDRAERRAQGDAHRVGDRVADAEGGRLERAKVDRVARLQGPDAGCW